MRMETARLILRPWEEADAQALFEEAQEKYPNCDVEVHMGGQPLYYYLIAVQ